MKLTSRTIFLSGILLCTLAPCAYSQDESSARPAEERKRFALTEEQKREINQLEEQRCAKEPNPCTPEEAAEQEAQMFALIERYCVLPEYVQYCAGGADSKLGFGFTLTLSAMSDEKYDETMNALFGAINEFAETVDEANASFSPEQDAIDLARVDEESQIIADLRAAQAERKRELDAQQADIDLQKKQAEQKRQWDEMWKKRNEEAIDAELMAIKKQKVDALRVQQQQEEAQLIAEYQQELAYHQGERKKWIQEGRIGDYTFDNNLSVLHENRLQNLRFRHAVEMKTVHFSAAEIASIKRAALAMWEAGIAQVAATVVV